MESEFQTDNLKNNLPRIIDVNIEEQMKSSYIDYSMSVIVGRALPDVRDGIKPVHRRILYAMNELGITSGKAHKKSARIVGEVLGKYHPHGDTAVYDSMVRMAQEWTMRYPLINGQGNFGSQDGDGPAAMRYTEAKMNKLSEEMLKDIEKDTVNFQLNFDDSLKEPMVLPTRIPQLLINGSSGIAVGMATNMLPHNLTDSINACLAYIDNKDILIEELMQCVQAPDFPTGGIIYGTEGVKNAMLTGRGKVVVRGKVDVEVNSNGKEKIIIYEVPYQVSRDNLADKIGQLVHNKVIEGISNITNQSNKQGTRIVLDLKRDSPPSKVIINQLYKYSDLQTSFGINNVALVKGRPKTINIKDIIKEFVEFRLEVIVRRTKFELSEAEKRAHILEGFLIALDHIDDIVNTIKNSPDTETAKTELMNKFSLSGIQAKAILELRLQRLTGLEREKIRKEYKEIIETIKDLKDILANESRQFDVIKTELTEIKDKYGDSRKTDIIPNEEEFDIKSLIEEEEVVITISQQGYIKRTPLQDYRQQKRGGRGAKGSNVKSEDAIQQLFITNTHNILLFFSKQGKCHWLNVYEIPEGTKSTKGRAIQNILQLGKEDKVQTVISLKDLKDKDFLERHSVVMCTRKGIVKKTDLSDFSRPRVNGIIAITIVDDDELLAARLCPKGAQIMLGSYYGRAVRFDSDSIRSTGRGAMGVKGIKLKDSADKTISISILDPNTEHKILVVSEKGFGKKTSFKVFRQTSRGASGVKALNITEKTGKLIALIEVEQDDDLMITCNSGITIRMPVNNISEIGRITQGVKLISLKENDHISAVATTPSTPTEAETAKS